MKVVYMSPGELVPYPGNAKQHPPEQVERIANSIKRFGWQQPIVVDRENVVIIGHGRLFAAKELMLDSVPVVYADNFQLTHGQNEFAEIHKAVFPVELPTTIINIASKCGSVLDLFGGTGTTLISCEQTGRKCFMMELDPLYVDVIIKRWEEFTGQKSELIQGVD